MVSLLQAEAHEDEAGEHEGRREVNDQEAGFGFEGRVVAEGVLLGDVVVEVHAAELAEDRGRDGREVEESFEVGFQYAPLSDGTHAPICFKPKL